MAHLDERFTLALQDLSDALDPKGIDWAVTGAVAANNYRDQIRTTSDLDVMLALVGKAISDVQDALHQRGWATIAVAEDFLLRMEHPEGGRVDVMVSGTDYETGAIARSHKTDHDEDLSFRMLAVEDVVILKLIADRTQDAADVESIIVARPNFDRDYMVRWFEAFSDLDLAGRFRRCENKAIERGLLREESSTFR